MTESEFELLSWRAVAQIEAGRADAAYRQQNERMAIAFILGVSFGIGLAVLFV